MRYLSITFLIFLILPMSYARGRQPCDRGAGGISHCEGTLFICNDGRTSKSKKICNNSYLKNPSETSKKVKLPKNKVKSTKKKSEKIAS